MVFLWLAFLACSGVIVVCGTNLSRYGDVIAEKTGLGRAWNGLILMASVASLSLIRFRLNWPAGL
jgi:cation:H+ antiporter